MQTSQCLSYRSLYVGEEGGPGGLPNLLKKEDWEENNEDDEEEDEMVWKRRDEEDIQNSLVVQEGMLVKFPLVPVATFSAPALRFFSPARRS